MYRRLLKLRLILLDRANYSRRLWALVALVPIACGWAWFLSSVPVQRWNSQKFKDSTRIALGDYRFDFSSQTVTPMWEDLTAVTGFPNPRGFSYKTIRLEDHVTGKTKGTSRQMTFRNTVYDHREKRMVHDFELSVSDGYPQFIHERMLVVQTSKELRWLDLNRGTQDWQSVPNLKSERPVVLSDYPNSVFRRTYYGPKATTQSTTELFRFTDEGQLLLLSTWSHAASWNPSFDDTNFSSERIYSLDVTSAFLESRSTVDGRLVDSIPFEAPITSFSFWYHDDVLLEKGTQKNFHSLAGKPLVNPLDSSVWKGSLYAISPDAKSCLWTDFQRAIVTEAASGKWLCEIKEVGQEFGGRFVFLDSKILVSTDNSWGLTLRQHDITTGETLLRWRPFWWILPCLIPLAIATLVWIWFWIRLPKPNTNWGWFDLYILMSLCMLGLVARVLCVGDPTDLSRLSFRYAQAICASGIIVAWYMLLFGSQRWIIRLIHLLATYSIVLLSLAAVLRDRPIEACQGLIVVSLPALFALPVWIVIAISLWIRRSRAQKQNGLPVRQHTIQMRDLFWFMGVMAVVMLGLKPLLPGMGAWLQMPWGLMITAWVGICSSLGLATALTQHKLGSRLGIVLSGLAALPSFVDIAMMNIDGEFWWLPLTQGRVSDVPFLMGCLSTVAITFVLAKCFKQSPAIAVADSAYSPSK